MKSIIAAFILLASPVSAQYYDGGGSFATYEAKIAAQRFAPIVILPMQCDSACIMQLVLPQACIQHGSTFGVHAAYAQPGGPPSEAATQHAFSYYRLYPRFQQAIRQRHAMATFQKTIFTDIELHSYGVRYCP